MSLGSATAPHLAPHLAPHFAPQREADGAHFERHFGEHPPAQADVIASADVMAMADRLGKFFMRPPYLPAHLGAHFLVPFVPHFAGVLAAQDVSGFEPHFDMSDAGHLPLHFGPQPACAAPPESASAEAMAMDESSERFFMSVSLVILPKSAKEVIQARLCSPGFFPSSFQMQSLRGKLDIRGPVPAHDASGF